MTTRDELEALYDQHGYLTPDLVLDTARPDDHPLHHRFEWNDTIAGEKYRLAQAQRLITVCKITFVTDDGEPHKIRAFQPVPREGRTVYRRADEIGHDPKLVTIRLHEMQRAWAQLRRRYNDSAEFWAMIATEIEQASPDNAA